MPVPSKLGEEVRPLFSGRVVYQTLPVSNPDQAAKAGLTDLATQVLLPRLQARTAGNPAVNHYSGISLRFCPDAIYLQAVLTNAREWGGLGFDFARLSFTEDNLYNIAVRRRDDWTKAETRPIAEVSEYFTETMVSPGMAEWVPFRSNLTFADCVQQLGQELALYRPSGTW